jgi:hypothetical protein
MPMNYEIRVRGRVDEHLVGDLGFAARVAPVETVLLGPVGDQDDLQEILSQLQDMGVELVEIRQLPAEDQ